MLKASVFPPETSSSASSYTSEFNKRLLSTYICEYRKYHRLFLLTWAALVSDLTAEFLLSGKVLGNLQLNLLSKSKVYEDSALSSIFLHNNYNYILKSLEKWVLFFYVLDLHVWRELFVWMNSGTMEVFFHGPFSKCDLICFLSCVFWLENLVRKKFCQIIFLSFLIIFQSVKTCAKNNFRRKKCVKRNKLFGFFHTRKNQFQQSGILLFFPLFFHSISVSHTKKQSFPKNKNKKIIV